MINGHVQAQSITTYKDPQARFTIQYPSTWKVSYVAANDTEFKPVYEAPHPFSESFSGSVFKISISEVPKASDKVTLQVKPLSLDQFVSKAIDLFSQTPGFEILRNNQTTIGGLPAREVTFLAYYGFTMHILMIKGDKLYDFILFTPELQVPQTLPVAQKMLQSFQFLG